MEQFEQQALNTAKKKPSNWYRYVDDTFVVWPHGEEELQDFLQHLNSLHPNIQFTMETEKDNKLAFLDVLVKKRSDGSLGHTVYRNPTHTDLYLHANSEHHLTQKQAVMRTLVHRARMTCDTESLEEELKHLKKTFRKNGYSKKEINHALKTEIKQKTNKERPAGQHFYHTNTPLPTNPGQTQHQNHTCSCQENQPLAQVSEGQPRTETAERILHSM